MWLCYKIFNSIRDNYGSLPLGSVIVVSENDNVPDGFEILRSLTIPMQQTQPLQLGENIQIDSFDAPYIHIGADEEVIDFHSNHPLSKFVLEDVPQEIEEIELHQNRLSKVIED